MLLTNRTGWIPDPRRPGDLHADSPEIKPYLATLFKDGDAGEQLPAAIDIQEDFPPVYDQGATNSCTANALAGLMDYYERKVKGTFVYPSRMFIYKTTRNFLKTESTDTGAYLRTAMEAAALFGAPPEDYWPFQTELLPVEPPAFLYAFGLSYRTVRYYRLDPEGIAKDDLLLRVKRHLAAGIPAAFGYFLFQSVSAAQITGEIPFPGPDEKGIGGHANVAVGYDDSRVVSNPLDGQQTTGAFRIRNSWGPGWGEDGYGWLPYEYALQSLAIDWWAILRTDFFNLDNPNFKIPETTVPKKEKK